MTKPSWDFRRWSVIRNLQDVGLTKASCFVNGQVLDLGGHKINQKGFFRLESIPYIRRLVLNINVDNKPDVQADAHSLPFVDQSFDTVWIAKVLLYCQDPGLVFMEASRVLKSGGHIVVYEPFSLPADESGDWHRLTAGGMKRYGLLAGLETVTVFSCGGRLAWLLQVLNDFHYYRAVEGDHEGRWIVQVLALFLPGLLEIDKRFCERDPDYARYTTGWIYVGLKL